MTRAQLEALAARVEAAQGADRELDAEIALACGIVRERDGNLFYGHKHHSVMVLERDYYDHEGHAPELPAYTVSLDAAASLVPEGWAWCVHDVGIASAMRAPTIAKAQAATPALALVAAALRALAKEAGDE